MRGESAVQLALAIATLPEAQQEAIRLRHLEGMSLAQIAQQMERSEEAVAGLIKRGLRGLRDRLATSEKRD
jgi:RNA polymerase sigma-70 factor (ECF subfamily)